VQHIANGPSLIRAHIRTKKPTEQQAFFSTTVRSLSTCRSRKSRNCVWITKKANPSHLIEILILWEDEVIPCDDQMKKGFCQFGKGHTRVVQPSIAVDFVGGGLFGRHEGAATAYVPTSSNSLQKRTQWIAKIRSGLACCWMTSSRFFWKHEKMHEVDSDLLQKTRFTNLQKRLFWEKFAFRSSSVFTIYISLSQTLIFQNWIQMTKWRRDRK